MLERKRTFGSQIHSTRTVVYTLEPARLYAVEASLTVDEIVPAHVDGTIGVAKSDSAASPEEENTYEEEE